MNELMEESMTLYDNVIDLQFTKFTKVEKDSMEQRALALLEKLCILFLVEKGTTTFSREEKDTLFSIFNAIFQELKKNRRTLMYQEFMEKLQDIKKRFFAVSQSDTCLNYIKDLQNMVEDFREELQKSNFFKYIVNIFVEIEDLCIRILAERSNIKKQQAFEAVTGVLSMGSSAASGALGIAGIVARTGGTVAAGSASAATAANAAKSATNVVAAVADDAVNAVGAVVNMASSAPLVNTVRVIGTATSCAANIINEAVIMGKAVSETVQSRKTSCRFEESFDDVFELTCLNEDFENDLKVKDVTQSCAKSIAFKIFQKLMADE